METNFNSLKMVELTALAKEHGLQDYYRMKKAELTALLRSMPNAAPWDDEPMSALSVSINLKPRSVGRPPKPMRPPPPPLEHLFNPYELEQAFGGGLLKFLNQWTRKDGCGDLPEGN